MPLKFAPLRLDFASSYSSRTKEIVRTYHEARDAGVKQVVEIIYNAVSKHIPDLEDFISDNDLDDRAKVFEKSARQLRKLLQAPKVARKKRKVEEELGDYEKMSVNDETIVQPHKDNSMASPEKRLPMGATDDELAIISAAREEYKASDVLGRSIPLPGNRSKISTPGTGRRRRSLYAWELRVNSGINPSSPSKKKVDTYLDIGDTFNFQVVLNRKDYHQLMNRRRIRKIEEDRKHKERNRAEQQRSNPLRGQLRRNSLEVGPYVEPSYKQRTMYRSPTKQKWVTPEVGFNTY